MTKNHLTLTDLCIINILVKFKIKQTLQVPWESDYRARNRSSIQVSQCKERFTQSQHPQGWEGDARAFDDPLFVNIDDPVGPDGIWFTEDDGLRLREGSPAIDAGYNDALGDDAGDLMERKCR